MKWIKPPAITDGKPTPSRDYYIDSECGTWRINKAVEPAVYMLVRVRGLEIVAVGTLDECKAAAQ